MPDAHVGQTAHDGDEHERCDADNDTVVRRGLTVKGGRGRDYESVEDHADQAPRVQGERTDPSAIHVTVVP
jgi:hypothetical protein